MASDARLLQSLEGHSDRVWALTWSPTGDMLASCSGDKTVRIWVQRPGTETWYCNAILEDAHTRTVRNCCWSPDGRHLATASFDATTTIWELQGGIWEQVATLEGHENEVKAVAWSPDGNFIATCGRDRSVWIWESLPGNEYECVDVKQGHTQDVKAVAWHPSGEVLASTSYDDTIKLWINDGDEWTCAQTLGGSGIGHVSTVWAVAFDAAGKHMVSCSDDCTLKIWQCRMQGRMPAWKHVVTISGHHTRAIYSVDWSTADLIATGDGSNCIKVFGKQLLEAAAADALLHALDSDATHGAWGLLGTIVDAHQMDINCVRWHPKDASLLASAGDDGLIKLWRWRPVPS